MSLFILYKRKKLNEIYRLIANMDINENPESVFDNLIDLQRFLLKEAELIKKEVLSSDTERKEIFILKNILKFINFNKFMGEIFERKYEAINNGKTLSCAALSFKGVQIQETQELLLKSIFKDINISNFINRLLKTTKNNEVYKAVYALSSWFRIDIDKDIRNSIESYKIKINKQIFENTKSNVMMREENLFIVNSSLYSKLNKVSKKIINNNKNLIKSECYFIAYDAYEMPKLLKDKVLLKNKSFIAWHKKMKENPSEIKVYDALEDLILSFHEGSKKIFNAENYLGYKLSFNKLIKTEKDINLLYSFLMNKMLPLYNNNGETLFDKKNAMKENLQSLKEAAEIKIEESKLSIQNIIENTLNFLSSELDFKYAKINGTTLEEEVMCLYEIEYNHKVANLLISLNTQGETNLSLLSPYYEKDNISPNYLILIDMKKEDLKKNVFSLVDVKHLFHELGHFFNMVYSNSADINIGTMESVEIPSIYMEEYLLKKECLQKILKIRMREADYKIIKSYLAEYQKNMLFNEITEGYIYNMLLGNIKEKGDIFKITKIMEKEFSKYNLILNEDNLYHHRIDIENWNLFYSKFDYINTNFVYVIGNIVAENMVKNQISIKKAFTNLFKYDMIKNDRYYWSKFVDF